MEEIRTDFHRIKKDIESISEFTSTPTEGVTRLPFTKEDKMAKSYLKERMEEAGLSIREDGVGTLIGKYQGTLKNAPSIIIGSHLDSVKNGGAFDGVAGIVAALEVARFLNSEAIKTKYPIEIVIMNDEEGVRFKSGMLSSRAITGKITEEELDKYLDENGISIRQAMIDFGIEPNLKNAKYKEGSIKAYLELHIEQGPILESYKKKIGIVKTIVGLAVYKVTISGKAGHAGTTPMDLRADALLTAAKAIDKLNSIVEEVAGDTVGTVGELYVYPGVANVIPGNVDFFVDLRSSNEENIKTVLAKFKKELKVLENEIGVKTRTKETFYAQPVELSNSIAKEIEKQTKLLGYEYMVMNSGAGHDAMIMAEFTDVGMIFVPSKNGISHTPNEWTDYERIQEGVELLINTVIALNKF